MKLLSLFHLLVGALVCLLPRSGYTQGSAEPAPVFAGVPQESLVLDAPDFKLFDRKFYDNQLFSLGESHGVQRSQELDFALLKHLTSGLGCVLM